MSPKRQRHPERWGRNVKARESNSHHQVEEQSLLTHSTCRNKCSRYISVQRAKTLCDELNKVTVKAEQDSILLSCLQVSNGGKQTEYRLRNERGEQCRVCQTFWSAVTHPSTSDVLDSDEEEPQAIGVPDEDE